MLPKTKRGWTMYIVLFIFCIGIIGFLKYYKPAPVEPKITYVMPERTGRASINNRLSPPITRPSEVKLDKVQPELEQTPTESNPIIGEESKAVGDDILDELSYEELEMLIAEVEDNQPVSAFGFGAFPEVPLDYPDTPIWKEDDYPAGDSVFGRDFMKSMELIERVLIKLWSQGNRVSSGSTHKGLILPHYPNTVYLEWDYIDEPDGTTTRYVSGVTSGPDVPPSVHDSIMDDGVIPSGITVLDANSEGIDPYSFLNLNQ